MVSCIAVSDAESLENKYQHRLSVQSLFEIVVATVVLADAAILQSLTKQTFTRKGVAPFVALTHPDKY